ncbi:Erg28-like protein, partial [Violaceomyces palustris]
VPVGALSKWLWVTGALAVFNCVENYLDHNFSRKVYGTAGAQITPLSSRMVGIWNLTSAMVRFYCAYHPQNKQVYELCMITFVIAMAHFVSELVTYKTLKLNSPGTLSPLIVAPSSLLAMYLSYPF